MTNGAPEALTSTKLVKKCSAKTSLGEKNSFQEKAKKAFEPKWSTEKERPKQSEW